jgi:nucleotide-binding universal stress UspA family protein
LFHHDFKKLLNPVKRVRLDSKEYDLHTIIIFYTFKPLPFLILHRGFHFLKFLKKKVKYSLNEHVEGRTDMFNVKKILVPTDFSQYSDAALEKAVDLASQYHAGIVLLHVIDEAIQQCAADYCLSTEVVKKLEEDSLKASNEKLKKEAEALAKAKDVEISFDIKKGAPADVILSEQMASSADLIVIASHGKTGLLKHLIGSVTDKVVRAAKCPVMVVRA